MICAHVAGGSTLYALTHLLVWVDGSMGFVFLAGVVLGIVRRRTTERYGFKVTMIHTLNRTRLVYVLHVGITVLALAVGTQFVSASHGISAETYGWPQSLLRTLVLALNPPLSILGLWVVLLLIGIGGLWLMSKGYEVFALCLSFALYATGKALSLDTGLPGQEAGQAFQVASWQFLFCLGLTIGWIWHAKSVSLVVRSNSLFVISFCVVLIGAVLAHLTIRQRQFSGLAIEAFLLAGFNKHDLGPGAIIFALATMVVLYKASAWVASTRARSVLRPVELLGAKSLDAYVISTVAAFVLPATFFYDMDGTIAQLLALAVVALCLLWAWCRQTYPVHILGRN